MHYAALGRPDTLQYLLNAVGPGQLAARDAYGETPVHCAALSENLETLRLTLLVGGNPDSANKDGVTPVHCAAAAGWVEGRL